MRDAIADPVHRIEPARHERCNRHAPHRLRRLPWPLDGRIIDSSRLAGLRWGNPTDQNPPT